MAPRDRALAHLTLLTSVLAAGASSSGVYADTGYMVSDPVVPPSYLPEPAAAPRVLCSDATVRAIAGHVTLTVRTMPDGARSGVVSLGDGPATARILAVTTSGEEPSLARPGVDGRTFEVRWGGLIPDTQVQAEIACEDGKIHVEWIVYAGPPQQVAQTATRVGPYDQAIWPFAYAQWTSIAPKRLRVQFVRPEPKSAFKGTPTSTNATLTLVSSKNGVLTLDVVPNADAPTVAIVFTGTEDGAPFSETWQIDVSTPPAQAGSNAIIGSAATEGP